MKGLTEKFNSILFVINLGIFGICFHRHRIAGAPASYWMARQGQPFVAMSETQPPVQSFSGYPPRPYNDPWQPQEQGVLAQGLG
jgi:hypothetical protein